MKRCIFRSFSVTDVVGPNVGICGIGGRGRSAPSSAIARESRSPSMVAIWSMPCWNGPPVSWTANACSATWASVQST